MNNITEHISDLTQLARLKMYIDKQKEDSDNKAFIIVLGVILGIIVVAAAVVAVLTVLKKKKKEDKKDDKKEVKEEKSEAVKIFQDTKAIKNRVVKLESLLEEAEADLEALRELRFEPEYYQDFRKMEELDAQIDDKHNEINALMKEWEEKMSILEQ